MDQGPVTRKHSRERRRRRGWIVIMLLGLVITGSGMVKLIGYGIDLLSSRRTARELREVYDAVPAEEEILAAAIPEAAGVPEAEPEPAAETEIHMEAAAETENEPEPAAPEVRKTAQKLQSVGYPGNPDLQVSSRFRRLQEKSGNIVGWLTISGTLDEPVARRDNDFYLDHNANGEPNINGAIFLDAAIGLDSRPYTYLLYGHNMKTGAMFGSLRNYENSAFYRKDPFITFDTMYEKGRFVVFAAGVVSTEESSDKYVDFYALKSRNIQGRQQAIDSLIGASVHSCEIDVEPEDQLLVLITCVDKDEERRVVAARRVRDGESEAILKKQVKQSW